MADSATRQRPQTDDTGADKTHPAKIFALSFSQQGMLLTSCVVLGLLLFYHALELSGAFLQPIEILRGDEYDFQIDINQANVIEWCQLDGIGETLAHRITEDRIQNGPFHSVDELQRVRGIGLVTLNRIRDRLLPVTKNNAPSD